MIIYHSYSQIKHVRTFNCVVAQSLKPQYEKLYLQNPSFTLMDPNDLTLSHPLSPKVMYSLRITGVRLENQYELLVMCHEQPESMSEMSSRPSSCKINDEKSEQMPRHWG